jgi:stage II sporulation protein D
MRKVLHVLRAFVLLILVPGLASSFFLPAENLQIRIFAHLKINSVQVVVGGGIYKIMADGVLIAESNGGKTFKLIARGDSMELRGNELSLGNFKYIKFFGADNAELRIKILDPDRKLRTYQNNLSFSTDEEQHIRIVNEVVLDNYIAGVTEAEAGSRSTQEFYKVQAILARTFALAHINKHVAEGFSLCDQVHCQAYYGKPRDVIIFNAVEATRGKVVVDDNLNLIVAAFHSNSGGQTANSEDVWGAKTSYLRSIVDTFSLKMPNFKWERRMLTDDWLSYLKLKHNYPTELEEAKEAALNFTQTNRKIYLECSNSKVPLKNVRTDLQLKSTFFSISRINKDSVVFKGRGYGHGLGMCQEGAMKMSRMGYRYTDILNFYYQNIQLIDLSKLSFFKDE